MTTQMPSQPQKPKPSFGDYLKNIFFILLFLSFAPALFESIRRPIWHYFEGRTKVAVLNMKSVIYDSAHYSKYLNEYFRDPSIKAILIRMDCPGSASGSGEAIAREIVSLKKKFPEKHIITLVENLCASGGYYIASATDYIIAPGSALIGSIGVQIPYFFQMREFVEQFKVHYVPLQAGKHKNVGNPLVDLTPANKEMVQSMLDDTYQQFTAEVAANRKLSLANAPAWADGKIFSGRQALSFGLIDALGSSYDAIVYLKEKAAIEGEIEWVKPPKQGSFSWLFGRDSGEDDDATMFDLVTDKICAKIESHCMALR